MAPEVLAHAFEPFFSTKEVGHGTGLGLAMVYGFAQQSGGHVSIESREGEGTSVTIVLRAVGREAAEAIQATGDDSRTLPSGRGKRILVVEDEPSVRQYVETQLKSLGYEVASVAAGHEAMALLEKGERFDLLFTDVVLPRGMSGVELSRLAGARCPGMKVLLTSGYSEEIFQQHGRPEEGTLLLKKPYRRKELAETLRKVLDG
jgi:CheY-like chemotaxis protein